MTKPFALARTVANICIISLSVVASANSPNVMKKRVAPEDIHQESVTDGREVSVKKT